MKDKREYISVFEHKALILGQKFDNGVVFDKTKLDAFVRFFGKGVPYFNLIKDGIQFNEYVGAIQVGNTLVNVLPKAEKRQIDDEVEKLKWNQVLIDMLRIVHGFSVKAPSTSEFKLRNNSVLDLYFELFIIETEKLLHRGLVKKYRKTEGNLTSLKGSIQFSKQLNTNLLHKERFFTKYSNYDKENLLNIILYKTLNVLKRINFNSLLQGRINALVLNFPEMPNQRISESDFDNLIFDRKSSTYKKAIEIARLILLHYHPDLSKGRNDVLALMFDMNLLWEQFILASLKKSKNFNVRGQVSKSFWKANGGNRRGIKPDIIIFSNGNNFVLDTKWKLIEKNPSIEDIKQMFAYHHYFDAKKVALLYPGDSKYIMGSFVDIRNQNELSNLECGLLFTQYKDSVKKWQKQILDEILFWVSN